MRALKNAPQSGVRAAVDDHPDDLQKYRCVLRLDSGGMAEVFLAVSQGVAGFNKLFVLKRLREALAEHQDHRDMFLHEARLAARLNHPNVVQTYEVGEDGTGIFIAMEYLEGQPLSRLRRELAKQELAVPHGIHARIVSEVLCGLHYAHELTDYDGTPLRIVHRDVSPQNVFVTYDGQVKLVDFGIAKTHDSGTQAGIFKGKFSHTAPEQLRGEAVDRRADVFTAGILLWELLTGHKLLAGDNPAQTIARLLNEPMPPVRSLAPTVDARLEAIAMRALERNPDNRYQTAQEMHDALEDYLVASGQAVRPDQIARLVCDLFRAERARVQQAIKDELATILQSSSNSRIVAAPRLAFNDDSVSLRTHGSLAVLHTSGGDDPDIEIVGAPQKDAPKRRRIAYALSAIAAMCALAYATTRKARDPGPLPPPNAPAEIHTVEPAVAPSTTVAVAAASASVAGTSAESGKPSATTKVFWHPKKSAASAIVGSPTPSPTATSAPVAAPPSSPPPAEASAKEKRKFRTDF